MSDNNESENPNPNDSAPSFPIDLWYEQTPETLEKWDKEFEEEMKAGLLHICIC